MDQAECISYTCSSKTVERCATVVDRLDRRLADESEAHTACMCFLKILQSVRKAKASQNVVIQESEHLD